VLYAIDALGERDVLEMSLAELVPPLAAAGISPTIVCLKSRGNEAVRNRLTAQGFDVRVLRPGGLASQVRQTADVARATDADLIHTALYRANIVGGLAGRVTRTPVVRSLVNTGYASERLADPRLTTGRIGIARNLRRHGFTVIAEPESFFVTKETHLEPDEEARARRWGADLATTLAPLSR